MNARLRLLLPASLAAAAFACASCGSGRQELQAAVQPGALVGRAESAPPAAQQTTPEAARRKFTPVVRLADGLELADEKITEKSEKHSYEIKFTFPQLKGRPGPQSARFNRAVRALAHREVDDFKGSFIGSEKDRPWTEEKFWADVYDSLWGSYEVIHLADDFASLRFDLYTYGRGAAHSVHSHVVLNLDLKSGRVLRLGDLFRPGARHLRALAAYSIADLKNLDEEGHRRAVAHATSRGLPASHAGIRTPDSEFEMGAGPTAENYRAWNLTAEGVVVSFAACQVMACADGEKEVFIPHSALDTIINWDGPAARVIKRQPR